MPLFLGWSSLNIYTRIGLVTLIGLISKHGILIVEFANQLRRDQGLSARMAVEPAAGMRLRAVLMTTAATVFGVLPLMLATGAGVVSRFDIGMVIASGMSVGTLFVLPCLYSLLAKPDHPKTYSVQERARPRALPEPNRDIGNSFMVLGASAMAREARGLARAYTGFGARLALRLALDHAEQEKQKMVIRSHLPQMTRRRLDGTVFRSAVHQYSRSRLMPGSQRQGRNAQGTYQK